MTKEMIACQIINYGFSDEVLHYIRELAPGNIKGEIKEVYLYVFLSPKSFYNDGACGSSQ